MSAKRQESEVLNQAVVLSSGTLDFRLELNERLKEQWRGLTNSGPYAQPFYIPEWFQAFLNSFGDGYSSRLVVIKRDEKAVGILPLMKKPEFFGRIPAKTLRSLSGIHSCRFDMIVDPTEDRRDVAVAAWSELEQDRSWDVIEALDVPENGSFSEIAEAARDAGYLTGEWPTRFSPILKLPKKGEDPMIYSPRGFRSFRKRLQTKLKSLGELGLVSFDIEPHPYGKGLDQFMELEAAGWKGANGGAIRSKPVTVKFYSNLVEQLQSRGLLRMYTLKVNNKPVSMQLGLYMNGVYYSPKAAYDEAFAKLAPGHLLVKYLLDDLVNNQASAYEFLGPRAFWKIIWTDAVVKHRNIYIFRPGLKGRALHALTMSAAAKARAIKYRWFGDPQEIKKGG